MMTGGAVGSSRNTGGEQTDHDMLVKVYTEIVGLDGNPGLVEVVRQLACRHNKLSKNFWILIGLLAGSGVIGAGVNFLELGGA